MKIEALIEGRSEHSFSIFNGTSILINIKSHLFALRIY